VRQLEQLAAKAVDRAGGFERHVGVFPGCEVGVDEVDSSNKGL
jgi:hypothetical protein